MPPAEPSAAQQVAAFIARFEPAVARLARGARARLRRDWFPTACELVYDNYNALAIGYGPTERTSQAVVSLATYARGVNLYFLSGATLPDPDGLLEGEGARGRFVRLTSLAVLDDPRVHRLLRAAIARAAAPFAARGRGVTIVKSVSARQRPRRPAP